MKNLKRVLSAVVVSALLTTSVAPAFAANAFTYETQAQKLHELGLFEGDSDTTYIPALDRDLKREEGFAMLLRLIGKEDDAAALTDAEANAALANFADKAQVSEWAKKIVAYAIKNGLVEGMNATTLAPTGKLEGKMFATLVLRNLGYTVNDNDYSNAAAILADKGGLTAAEAVKFNNKQLIRDDLVGMAFGSLLAKDTTGATIIEKLVEDGEVAADKAEAAGFVIVDGVKSVSAVSAKSIKVTFSKAVADTSKVVLTVKRATTDVAVTTTWNEAKTEATLTSSANLPEGSYTVAVKNDSKDLGSSTVSITAQKIAKIEITSTKLSVVSDGTGYATYKVLDQYNNDITSSYFASNIKFQTGVGNADHKNGIITITPTSGSLIQFANVVITGYDTTSGVSVTSTLATSTALGTLSDFKLGDISNVVLTAGDVTSVYYIPYTALDISGNETKNYDLVNGGLIMTGGVLSVSNPNVQAKIVRDPADSSKAAVELKVISTGSVMIDMPVTITAMTYTGKTSSVNTTIKKSAEVNSLTLMTPSTNIAVGDKNKTIPFEAFDQNGNKVTKYSDLNGKVTLSGGIALAENVDGSAKVVITPIGVDGPQIVSAIVSNSGKMSTLTLNIQKQATADSLELDSSVFVTAMENNAVQKVDFGHDVGGLKVKDQYGRDINMVTGTNTYKVAVTSSGTQLAVGGNDVLSVGNTQTTLTANDANGNSGTVTFTLFNDVNTNGVQDAAEATIDTKSVSLSIIKSTDIKGYSIDAVTSPIFANSNAVASLTDRDNEFYANPKVFGKTAAGAKVVLAGAPIVGAYVDNTSEFTVTSDTYYDGIKVVAGKLADPTKTEASTTLTVTVKKSSGALQVLTTNVKSSTEAPKATDISFEVKKFVTGLSVDGDVVKVKAANVADAKFATGAYMTKFDKATDAAIADASVSNITFYAKDQYGTKAMELAQFSVVDQKNTDVNGVVTSINKVSITNDGQLTVGAVAAGDSFKISAVTNNGLIKTIKVVIE